MKASSAFFKFSGRTIFGWPNIGNVPALSVCAFTRSAARKQTQHARAIDTEPKRSARVFIRNRERIDINSSFSAISCSVGFAHAYLDTLKVLGLF
jgi:hypothetical protein